MKFWLKVALISGISLLSITGLKDLAYKHDAKTAQKQAEAQVANREYQNSLRAKEYILTPGRIISIPVAGMLKIQWRVGGIESCKFRCLLPGSRLPMKIRGSGPGGWRTIAPGEYISSWELPNPGEVAVYEFAWWTPPGSNPSVRSVPIYIGFEQ